MSQVINGNINDILGTIKDIQDKNVYPVYIPSLKKNVMFKEMTTKQEKTLVKTIVDSPIYNSEFIFAIREIIKENCAEEIDVDNLTVIDKTAICLSMRLKSIGSRFEYTFSGADLTKEINVAEYVDRFKDINIPKNKVVGDDTFKIECGYPTILTEYTLEKEFRSNTQELDIKNLDEAREALGNVFTNELVKYIKKITIKKDEETEVVLDMNDYTFANRISIVETIGNKVTSAIIQYIDDANKEVKEKLKIELELNTEQQKEFKTKKLNGLLEANSNFFINS